MKKYTLNKTQRKILEIQHTKELESNVCEHCLENKKLKMKTVLKSAAIVVVVTGILAIYNNMLSSVVPFKAIDNTTVEDILYAMGAPEKDVPHIANAIKMASKQTNISENLIIALMATESNFNKEAVSSLGYFGLMQIPGKWDVRYVDVNVLIGARIFKEKLYMTHGNVREAICIYKGWRIGDAKGMMNADKVIRISKQINSNI